MENGKLANFFLEWETKSFLDKSLLLNVLLYIQVFLLLFLLRQPFVCVMFKWLWSVLVYNSGAKY